MEPHVENLEKRQKRKKISYYQSYTVMQGGKRDADVEKGFVDTGWDEARE